MISKKVVRRFSLLLLGESEYYFQDYGGYLFLPEGAEKRGMFTGRRRNIASNESKEGYTLIADRRKIKGRFHIASMSVMFEPDDIRYPVYRIPLVETTGPRIHTAAPSERSRSKSKYLLLNTKLVIEMKENNQDHPYRFHRGDSEFAFMLTYAKLEDVHRRISALHDLAGKDRYVREKELQRQIAKREADISFDISWLVDYSERPQHLDGQAVLASQITPLVESPGRMMLTDKRLYVQHFNNVSTEPLDKYDLSLIEEIHKRRYAMRDRGLEFIFRSSSSSPSSLSSSVLSIERPLSDLQGSEDEDEIYDLILRQSSVRMKKNPGSVYDTLEQARILWHKRKMSNYDYLLHVNHAAGRSFNDLTQYPVFPWVLSDYTSRRLDLKNPEVFRDLTKPIGALEPNRLRTFRKRMRDMPAEMSHGKPFLYGTHYSTPGYVLYFLVRQAPEYMLRLQSGHFDVADRLFHSMENSWQSVLTSNTDVKELIPEFYNSETKGSFCLNTKNLDLGVRQDGDEVDDLELPRWARSARDFVKKMREALESDYVSQNIHHWIDLIFGYKQTGDAAVKADNVFFPLTYEGAIDIEAVKDPTERASMEAQIREFGQIPRQIFRDPHPARDDPVEKKVRMRRTGGSQQTADGDAKHSPGTQNKQAKPSSTSGQTKSFSSLFRGYMKGVTGDKDSSQRDAAATETNTNTGNNSMSAITRTNGDDGNDGNKSKKRTPIRESPKGQIPDGGMSTIGSPAATVPNDNNDGGREKSNNVVVGRRDIKAPSMLHADQESNPYCSRWRPFKGFKLERKLKAHRKHLTDVCVDNEGRIFCSVGMDASLRIHQIQDGKQRRAFKVKRRNLSLALSSCVITPDANTVVAGSWDNSVYVYSVTQGTIVSEGRMHEDAVSSVSLSSERVVSGSWDGSVKLWALTESRIDPRPLLDLHEHDHPVTSVCSDPTARVACSASQDGVVLVWDLRTGKRQRTIKAHSREVTSMSISNTGYDVTTASNDKHIKTFDLTKGDCFLDIHASELVSCVETDGEVVFSGGESGMVKLWDINDGKASKQKPRLKTTDLENKVTSFSLSRDGAWLVAGVESEEGEEDVYIFSSS
eukprot:CAMPEP_0114497726 /NCGR_PEP_ID=MMETSP0109-20121206/6488_1 /TAXON_ID=29199 /ORGANISM="Chlorarachnion reptans, Strain CCCM449" /LENGTH=1094 /DNA_ID=CAMNT_0001675147 /DNA_START=324 /DNA_END=3609 /DNA_ORIENTATION=-